MPAVWRDIHEGTEKNAGGVSRRFNGCRMFFGCSGKLSGWMDKVNGWHPNYGCSRYQLKDGDVVNWRLTCNFGRDVGCDWNVPKK
jgi:hypothetical protein